MGKILYLIKTMDVGGTERFTYNLSTHMQKIGYEVSIYSSGGIFVDELREKEIGYIYSENANKIGFRNFLKIRQEIKQIIKKKKYDIIHCQDRIFVFILSTLNTRNATVIYTANNYFNDFAQFFIRPDKAIGISPSIVKNLAKTIKIKKENISRIHYGVQTPDPVPWKKKGGKSQNITIGYVGKLLKEKGIMNLLEAFKDLFEQHPEIRLKIVGDGPFKFNIMQFINDNHLNDIVDFFPPITDPDSIYKNIDILTLPSQMREGLPISILEAQARGILVITKNSTAISDIIKNNETGIIMQTGSRKDIYFTLDKILSNYPDLKKMLKTGKENIIENYSFEDMINQYTKLYDNIFNE